MGGLVKLESLSFSDCIICIGKTKKKQRKRKIEKKQKKKKTKNKKKKEKEEKSHLFDVIGGWGGENERALRKVAQRGGEFNFLLK